MPKPLEELYQIRKDKLDQIIRLGINPYPSLYKRTHLIKKARRVGLKVKTAGRIRAIRSHGRLTFFDLEDRSGMIQVLTTEKTLGKKGYKLIKLLDIGDFVGVEGEVFKTKAGEITIKAVQVVFLSKALYPIPDSWFGLKDKEERFRKRYLDLLLNKSARQRLSARWMVLRAIREFLWREDFTEVETPILQNLYGGTNARPFTTRVNALGVDMYLRIAPELYLKRLIVGGYEKIFEIARNFRNEGLDQTHQPEFTMIEIYQAYTDYFGMMDLTENLFRAAAQAVNGHTRIKVDHHEIDLSFQWRRITIDEALKIHLGINWQTATDKQIQNILAQHNFTVPGLYTRDKALFTIYDHLVTPKLIEPTWVIDYPQDVSPLAKGHRRQPGRVERFEGYIGGKEICDGWSEINSPVEQRHRFNQEQKGLKAGDEEAHPLDEDFLTALSYGCPPVSGVGIGIDRLVMLLTNTWQIREVIAFPLMKPKKPDQVLSK